MKIKAGKAKKTQVKVKDMKPKKNAKGGQATFALAKGLSGNTVGLRGFGAISNPS